MTAQEPIRRQVYFTGRVQGVGFRFTAVAIAERFEVTGFVRNLPDGRVELVAEGRPEVVEAFVRAVTEEMGAFIRDVRSIDSPVRGEYAGFRISW